MNTIRKLHVDLEKNLIESILASRVSQTALSTVSPKTHRVSIAISVVVILHFYYSLLGTQATITTANMHTKVVHNCYFPKETAELCSRAGVQKANMRIDKIFFSSTLAGMLLGFACAAALSTYSSPWYQDNAPGLIRMIGAIIFPFGLVMIVLTGADLCTGSFRASLTAPTMMALAC